jgi:DNA-directed RNA polymerase subunit RPC12/RpoP
MAQSRKGKLNYRCPHCFMRDIDIDLFFDRSKNSYYCLRCGSIYSESDIIRKNNQIREKYRLISKRVVDFNEDNQPISFKENEKGGF